MIPSNTGVVLSALAFLGTLALLGLAVLATVVGVLKKNTLLTRGSVLAGLAVVALYSVALVGAGLLSSDRTLPTDAEKYFCELDCHLAYRVEGVKLIGQLPGVAGEVWSVTVRTRFDERTIASFRPREAPLTPNPRRARVIAADGREFPQLSGTIERLTALGIPSVPLERELRPGESYDTVLLFELPAGAAPSSLELTEDVFPDQLLIGHELSPFHGRTRLALPAPAVATLP
jgi:hypothetical protein